MISVFFILQSKICDSITKRVALGAGAPSLHVPGIPSPKAKQPQFRKRNAKVTLSRPTPDPADRRKLAVI